MKFCYPAVFKKNQNGSYTVRFPDLECCTAEGMNYEEALANAKNAEREWLELECLEELKNPPFVSEVSDIIPGEDESVQIVAVNIRFMEGWDE